MSATVTATGYTGAGVTLTAGVFNDIIEVDFDVVKNLLTLKTEAGQYHYIDISAATTITATKSGSTYTFTVS